MGEIRNFSIIAHIDHGKSTLADRMLELTGTIEHRKMRAQVLDAMEIERERGITIKMTPVTMNYKLEARSYQLNLIDTPGHIDFSYEVSRALRAVEGVVLLVDAAQGVQAQTLAVLDLAREAKLTILPVINKIDLPFARVAETREELVRLLGCPADEILAVSGKTGEGVAELLEAIVARVPPPTGGVAASGATPRALVFDFEYSNHQGVIVYLRVLDGPLRPGDRLQFAASGESFAVTEVGRFLPEKAAASELGAGSSGYLVTGLKQSRGAKVGDTIIAQNSRTRPVPGYQEPRPVVWASIYPESQDEFAALATGLWRLSFGDASLSFEEESAGALGRGYRCGFLGLLHLEITVERLRREHGLTIIATTPTITYRVAGREITAPHFFPESVKGLEVVEPWAEATIIAPAEQLGSIVKLFNDHEVILKNTENFTAERIKLLVELPLRELMRRFFADLKSVSAGFASFSYHLSDWHPAPVVRLDAVVGGEVVPALSRIVAERRLELEAGQLVDKLKTLLPRQLVEVRIQAQAHGRILASRSLAALRKDVTGYLYGGDISRKKKLWAKQQKGKKKMQQRAEVKVPSEVFLKMLSSEE
jgi:GTP-binding protein LepA